MGRKPTNKDAVPRLRKRRQKSGRVCYYYDHGIVAGRRKEEPLGSDYGVAIKRWAEIEQANTLPAHAIIMFRWVTEQYIVAAEAGTLPRKKAPRTIADNRKEIAKLLEFFDDPPAPLDAIKPVNVRQYMTWRTKGGAAIRANRDKSLLSAMWNFARDRGYTEKPNPCKGILGNEESGREVYIEQDQFDAIWNAADATLQDAMDLAYLTGQRPADVCRMAVTDVRDGFLSVRQGKTGKRLRIEVSPDLRAVLDRIGARKAAHKVYSTRLVVNEWGRPVGVHAVSNRFAEAREKAKVVGVEFRDIRAKAGTDKTESAGDIRQAQAQLGHKSVTTTEGYVRNRRGQKVTPTR